MSLLQILKAVLTEIKPPSPVCQGCKKTPSQLEEYKFQDEVETGAMTPDQYVRSFEGTYNRANGHFLCTDCYINAGMPSVPHPGRWVCP